MKSNAEIRSESLACARQGRWIFRFLTVGILFGIISATADGIVDSMLGGQGIKTWMHYIQAKTSAAAQGLVYTAPSSSAALRMHGASVFSLFIKFIFTGITYVALAGVYLKAVRKTDERWLADAFSNFARPLACAWLVFVVFLRIWLWSLLFIVPGIIAGYRYSQVWNIKADHPDWGASRCIAESARLMKGFKMQRFRLDVSFVLWIIAALLPLLAGVLLALNKGVFPELPAAASLVLRFMELAGFAAAVFIGIWMTVARTVFYRAVCDVAQSRISTDAGDDRS